MAKALRDAGFKHVSVEMSVIMLEGQKYEVDAHLVQWQQDAIDFDPFDPEDNDEDNDEGNDEGNRNDNGNRMTPMTMQLDFERRSVKFLKTMPWTT